MLQTIVHRVVIAAGTTDCEARADGFLLQPVNALSSLAFAVVGIVIMGWARVVTGSERTNRIIFGVILVATGVGSFLYHGYDGAVVHLVHDITFLAALMFIVVMNGCALLARPVRTGYIWTTFLTLLVSIVLVVTPATTNVFTAGLVVAIVVSDVMIRRHGGIDAPRWWIAVVAMSAAVAAFVMGRTAGPLCDPGSVVQGHALWHMLSAVALGSYFAATTPVRIHGRRTDEPTS
ncbi:MAG: hypothetical protein KDB69_06955 [Acidimicrobiia bacterium]|nr:hypothetical protein [Acidimicrobiia bacterium]